jgi:hypothetical protein
MSAITISRSEPTMLSFTTLLPRNWPETEAAKEEFHAALSGREATALKQIATMPDAFDSIKLPPMQVDSIEKVRLRELTSGDVSPFDILKKGYSEDALKAVREGTDFDVTNDGNKEGAE